MNVLYHHQGAQKAENKLRNCPFVRNVGVALAAKTDAG